MTRSIARSAVIAAASLWVALSLTGCDILDVENPNSLVDEDLQEPSAAPALANGALAVVAEAAGEVLTVSSVASDELVRIGTKDAYDPLDFGNLSDPRNEFVNPAYTALSEARWTADEAVRILEEFSDAGDLDDLRPLARSYLYAGLAYLVVGDHFEDFVFSDRREVEPPLGEDRMDEVYEGAEQYFTRGLALARELGDDELERTFLAARARGRHAKRVREKLDDGAMPADPLVDAEGVVDDARAFLDRIGPAPDWRYEFAYSLKTVSNDMAYQVNQRNELMWQAEYVEDPEDEGRWRSVTLLDPVDAVPDPVLSATIERFMDGRQFAPLTVLSAREIHLLLAEAHLARGDLPAFRSRINAVRSLDGLTPYDDQVPAEEILKHERRVNLFAQGRRLLDHYRFGEPSGRWQAGSEAVQSPGTLFPIGDRERRTNCYILGTC